MNQEKFAGDVVDELVPINQRQKELTSRAIWRAIALFLLGAILYRTFEATEWRPNFDDNSIVCRHRSWWGLKQKVVRCEWRRDPDRVPDHGWCAKYPDGKWHIFYAEEFDQMVIYWPR